MDVILLQDLEKVGDKYDVVTVKDGYGRNFLIPRKLALIANETNNKRLADFRKREAAAEAKKIGVYQDIVNKVTGKSLRIGAKAGTSGKIFGSVTNVQLLAALKEQLGVEIDRKKIQITSEVKELGSYTAMLKLHPDVITELAFEVVAE